MSAEPPDPTLLAREIARRFADHPAVVAVAMGGSRGTLGLGAVAGSDLDLEVYTRGDVPIDVRRDIVHDTGGAARAELGGSAWGLADEWVTPDGLHVDLAFFDAAWMADRVAAVVERHEPSMGYTTCFWHTIRGCHVLEDREGWLAALRARADVPYPEPLRRAIVAHNHPVLRAVLPAYAAQLARAVERGDLVSINHRLAALLASYVDIVFAVNRVTHPGEKRLITAMTQRCTALPVGMAADLDELLRTATTDLPGLSARLDRLLDRLDDLLRAEGFTDADLPSLRR